MHQAEAEDALRRTVVTLHRTTGAPIAYGGLVTDGRLRLSQLQGTNSSLLEGLTIHAGRGLGGRTLVIGQPMAVRDYHHAKMISHEYDEAVRDAGVRAAIAVPVVVRRAVRAVVYAARREPVPLGSRAVQAAIAAARDLEQELVVRDEVDRRLSLLRKSATDAQPTDTSEAISREAVRQAYAELRILVARSADDEIGSRLRRACAALASALTPPGQPPRPTLSPRELDVLSCVALGHTNAEVANELGLEPGTVKSYLRSAMRKLDAHTRTQAVVAARRVGLLP